MNIKIKRETKMKAKLFHMVMPIHRSILLSAKMKRMMTNRVERIQLPNRSIFRGKVAKLRIQSIGFSKNGKPKIRMTQRGITTNTSQSQRLQMPKRQESKRMRAPSPTRPKTK